VERRTPSSADARETHIGTAALGCPAVQVHRAAEFSSAAVTVVLRYRAGIKVAAAYFPALAIFTPREEAA
jgi:hypothetical protein